MLERSTRLLTLAASASMFALALQLAGSPTASAAGAYYEVTSVSERTVQSLEQVYAGQSFDSSWTESTIASETNSFHHFPANMRTGGGYFELNEARNCSVEGWTSDCNALRVPSFTPTSVMTYDRTFTGDMPPLDGPSHCERQVAQEPGERLGQSLPAYVALDVSGGSVTAVHWAGLMRVHWFNHDATCAGEPGQISNPLAQPPYDSQENSTGFAQSIPASTLQRKNFQLSLSGSREYTVPWRTDDSLRTYRYRVAQSVNIGVCRIDHLDVDPYAGCRYGGAAEGVTVPVPKPRPHNATCTGRCATTTPLSDDEKFELLAAARRNWQNAALCTTAAADPTPSAVPTRWVPLASTLTQLGITVVKSKGCDDQVELMTTSAIQVADPPAPAHRTVPLAVRGRIPSPAAGACASVGRSHLRLCNGILAAARAYHVAQQEYAAISSARATSVNRLATALGKGDRLGASIQSATLRAYASMSVGAAARVSRGGVRLAALLEQAGIDRTISEATLQAAYAKLQSGSAISRGLLTRMQRAGVVRTRADARRALEIVHAELPAPSATSLLDLLRAKLTTKEAARTAASMRSGDLAVLVRGLVAQGAVTATDARVLLGVLNARTCQVTRLRAAARGLRVRVPSAKQLVVAGASRIGPRC